MSRVRHDLECHHFGCCTIHVWQELGYLTGHFDVFGAWDRETIRRVRKFLCDQAALGGPWQIALPENAPRAFARWFHRAGGRRVATRRIDGVLSDIWILRKPENG